MGIGIVVHVREYYMMHGCTVVHRYGRTGRRIDITDRSKHVLLTVVIINNTVRCTHVIVNELLYTIKSSPE